MAGQRLDSQISVSWFVILIPLWLILLPTAALTILYGLAAQDKTISVVERVIISTLVPLGFLITLVLFILKIEDTIDTKNYFILIPHWVSLLALYIYKRYFKIRNAKIK